MDKSDVHSKQTEDSTTLESLVGKYVPCTLCRTNTRVEIHFENDELILWCGHHQKARCDNKQK